MYGRTVSRKKWVRLKSLKMNMLMRLVTIFLIYQLTILDGNNLGRASVTLAILPQGFLVAALPVRDPPPPPPPPKPRKPSRPSISPNLSPPPPRPSPYPS
ncbi:hypothetical protein ACH5RR_019116 [Cinchona calisaya]|uniref:Uncharacterized protein n=1 Tax=Cinchona calisaya TaxID=153742 RepID=A0ABD2ZS17_9GENT